MSISIIDRLLAAPIFGPGVTCLAFRLARLVLHIPALRRGVLVSRAGVDAREAKALVHEITFGTMWRNFVREQRRLVSDTRRQNQQMARIDCAVVIVAES